MKFLYLPFIIFLTLFFSCDCKKSNNEVKKEEVKVNCEEIKKRIEETEIISKKLQKGGRLAVIKIDDENGFIRNSIKQGSHVDVLAMFDDPKEKKKMVMTLLENVVIIDIDNKDNKTDKANLSFYVLPQEGEILFLAQRMGKLNITLRNEDDLSLLEEKERITKEKLTNIERFLELQEIRKQTIQKGKIIRGGGENDSNSPQIKYSEIDKGGRGFFIKISDEEKYLNKIIKPGDSIDISGIFIESSKNEEKLITLLENVIVLKTDEEISKGKDFKNTYLMVYLLPQEAELLMLAQDLCILNVSLRNFDDLSLLEERDRTTFDTILTGDRTMELQEVRKQTVQRVKIIRGGEDGNYSYSSSSVTTNTTNNNTNNNTSSYSNNPITQYQTKKYKEISYDNDTYENDFKSVDTNPLSTFSIDVDTGAYSQIRKNILSNAEIRKDVVRIEELINYFDYEYTIPQNEAFSVNTEVGQSLFDKNKHIIAIGIQGIKKEYKTLPPANLVFLIDVSGSMGDANKMDLLKKGFLIFINDLKDNDKISIITYADGTNVLLDNVSGKEKDKIKQIIESLQVDGSTNGEGGIQKAYETAIKNFIKGGINRILLCTDGDFNLGVKNVDELKNIIAEKRKTEVSLSTIGFGITGYNDKLMEQIADVGNGNYSYIDSYNEMVKVLSTELTSTFDVIAKDVKIQVEFNPEFVESYRLIGYKNRMLKSEDFNNDEIDAGEIGAGHKVTALYEISLKNENQLKSIDELKYQKLKKSDFITYISDYKNSGEFAEIKVRYKKPDENKSSLVKHQLFKKDVINDISKTSNDFKFALSVAAFGQYLLKSDFNGSINLNDIISLATEGKGTDKFGYREEFIQLLKKYKY